MPDLNDTEDNELREAIAKAIDRREVMDEKDAEIERLARELEVLEERYWESACKHAEKTAGMQAEIERLESNYRQVLREVNDQSVILLGRAAENERLTTELRLVRQYARDLLARIDASPERTLLEAAIFE